MGKMKLTTATGRTYFVADGIKPHQVVCVSEAEAGEKHVEICLKFYKAAATKRVDKAWCKALKNRLVKQLKR